MSGRFTVIEPVEIGKYKMPTRVIFGRGSLDQLKNIKEIVGSSRVVIICGDHFKLSQDFKKLIKDLGSKVIVYGDTVKKSTFFTINSFTDFCRENNPSVVVSIGGGAILDTGKCGAILAVNGGFVEDYVKIKKRNLEKKGITFIAIPTTAGTGSEVTPWATVWGNDNLKYSLSSPEFMFPDVALVDSSLTDSLSREITAESGIDSLAQAIEAYWNVNHNSVSDKYALKAIEIIMNSLEKAVNNPDYDSRDKMSLASLTSGLAFSNTATTICHSISYPITAHWNVSHGQAVSITLPAFFEYIVPVLDIGRRKKLLESIKANDEKEGSLRIYYLMKNIWLKTKLSELGISKKGIGIIVEEGYNPDRARNAPRIPSNQELKEMLLTIY